MALRRRYEALESSNHPWDKLPPKLLDYLLSRLSVKELLRCRIVCKVWLWMIDCTYPWMKYLSTRKTLIFGCLVDDEITGPIIYALINTGDDMVPQQIVSFPKLRGFRHGISGKVSTSNGLILLERQDKSFRILESAVVNPLTKVIVMVPGSPYRPVAFDNLALGYSALGRGHKLVQLLVRDDNNNLGAAIYNLRGESSWRFIPFPDSFLASSHGAFENQDQERRGGVYAYGSLFWTLHGPTQPIMVSFHMTSEKFRLLPMPRRHLERYELANVGRWPTLWDLSFGDRIEILSLIKGLNKKMMWIMSWVMLLNGHIYMTDNVTGVYHYGRDCLLIRGRHSSTGESLFVLQHNKDRFFNSTLKDGSRGHLDVYSHSWDFNF